MRLSDCLLVSLSWEPLPPDFPLGNGSWAFLWTSVCQFRLASSFTFAASPGISHLRGIFILNQWASHLVAAVHQTGRCSETAQESSHTQEWLCNGDILFAMITWASPNDCSNGMVVPAPEAWKSYIQKQSITISPSTGRLRQEAVVNSRLAWHLYLVSSRISGARVRLCLQTKIRWKWVTNKYQIKIYSKPILPK